MGKVFCIFGKSASGKDSIYKELISDKELKLMPVISYTTRPMRENEVDGRNYNFVSECEMNKLISEGKIIERRVYDTVFGPWYYFTADDGSIQLNKYNYLVIGTLEAYMNIKNYFGSDNVVPLYIAVDDGVRLMRAIERERQQVVPAYGELCRRFLADCKDFSDENLLRAGIDVVFENEHFTECLTCLKTYICELISKETK